jgi:small GTP-binding protein
MAGPLVSVKTVIVGDSSVGKTCLLHRFTREAYSEGSQPTLGVEFVSKLMDSPKGRHLELQLWDTAGQETFRTVTRGYYRSALVAYFVFDLAKGSSFASLDQWLSDVKSIVQSEIVLVLIGNKSDLETRDVDQAEVEAFVTKNKMKYFECSAKSGKNVLQAFTSVLVDLDQMADEGRLPVSRQTESIVYDQEPKQQGCC